MDRDQRLHLLSPENTKAVPKNGLGSIAIFDYQPYTRYGYGYGYP